MIRSLLASVAITAFTLTPALAETFPIEGSQGTKLQGEAVASFDQPWAMTFMDDTRALVTTKPGKLIVVDTTDGSTTEVTGVPKATVGGQGGMGDVVLHPDFASNGMIYLSFVESLDGGATRGAVVVRGKLVMAEGKPPALEGIEPVWTQLPKLPGQGHFSHRIAFGPEGSPQAGNLFITSGDRQKQTPAQSWDMALGKVIRLNDDGSVPADNPWQDKGELAKTFWSTGHRNLLGIDFDASGQLWTNEMGPKHGDELNRIEVGNNYGWPVVSNGDNYNGVPIPDHDTRPEFNAPEAFWVPSIAPAGLVIYDGDTFADWKGDAFIGGLVSQALIRVDIAADGSASEAERYSWRKRIREVEQGPDGAIWVLEDRDGGRLVKLTPAG
ncbi:PQQ-dependent sugar dehydrogenase [Ahrensia sp. R2A130]|uniref:PQQ-dependent sugar dehydrogenase n=1 Tax=Ahrensia sp. R2A130 TaxID=744979 RepID=UPI0001E0D0BF|nr:PQQ-dependent sugar dehydrogenase [Ahrensia sp. R2A130]EFL90864.1 soluble aldose sugar dehydrogenase YliI [Ahrensia sp. R2A130]